MNISIPQIVTGIISMFIGILAIRVIMPIINPILALAWHNELALVTIRLTVYLIIAFIIYIIIYGTVMGKMPDILKQKKSILSDGSNEQEEWNNDMGW